MKIPRTYYPKRFWYRKPKAWRPQPAKEVKGGVTMANIQFKTFLILVSDGKEQEFIDHIEALCKLYAEGQAYHYLYEVEK